MASIFRIRAFLAECKMQTGSRLKAACTNPQNNQSMIAPNATLRDSTKEALGIYLTARRFKDGYAVTATTALAHPTAEENPYKKLQTGN